MSTMESNPLELHLKNFYVSLPQDANLTQIQSVDPGNFKWFFTTRRLQGKHMTYTNDTI